MKQDKVFYATAVCFSFILYRFLSEFVYSFVRRAILHIGVSRLDVKREHFSTEFFDNLLLNTSNKTRYENLCNYGCYLVIPYRFLSKFRYSFVRTDTLRIGVPRLDVKRDHFSTEFFENLLLNTNNKTKYSIHSNY